MKKITLLILSLLYFSVGHSQILLEDFESDPASYSLFADGVTSVGPVSDPETNGTRGEVLKNYHFYIRCSMAKCSSYSY